MLEKYIRDDNFIEVDLSEVQKERELEFLVSIFIKFDAMHEKNDAVEEFLECKEQIIDTVEKKAHYVGMRVVDGWSELFFYTQNAKGIEQQVAAALQQCSYKYEISIIKDHKWDFYYQNLYPTDLELYLIYSKKIVLQMMQEGDSLIAPREVEHYVSFDTASQKDRFVADVAKVGFVYKDDIDAKELPHAVAVTKEHALDQDTLRKVISEILEYVQKYHGHYELWSAMLVHE